MSKFKVKWKEIVDYEAIIEAKDEEEAIDKAYEHNYESEDDIIDTVFDEDSVNIAKL